jgi:hypothetical protein
MDSNPLAAEWGTVQEGHPEPQNRTFTETYTSLVYWQDIVLTLRNYPRKNHEGLVDRARSNLNATFCVGYVESMWCPIRLWRPNGVQIVTRKSCVFIEHRL